jgi:hypothetical protein
MIKKPLFYDQFFDAWKSAELLGLMSRIRDGVFERTDHGRSVQRVPG